MEIPVMLLVKHVPPDQLQILEPMPGQQRVLRVPLAYIHYRRALLHARPAPLLPTPLLSNAPLVPIKQLQPVTQVIMDILVMHLVKLVVLIPLQILEPLLGQQRVIIVLLGSIRWMLQCHVRTVPP